MPSQVYVMGATNAVHMLDPDLLRPGRFDHVTSPRVLFVSVTVLTGDSSQAAGLRRPKVNPLEEDSERRLVTQTSRTILSGKLRSLHVKFDQDAQEQQPEDKQTLAELLAVRTAGCSGADVRPSCTSAILILLVAPSSLSIGRPQSYLSRPKLSNSSGLCYISDAGYKSAAFIVRIVAKPLVTHQCKTCLSYSLSYG
eukprot:753198-Hanusia_phi.AAC.4